MYLCTACNEFSASDYFDSYDDEIYIKCRICGKICGEAQTEETLRILKTEKETHEGMRKL